MQLFPIMQDCFLEVNMVQVQVVVEFIFPYK